MAPIRRYLRITKASVLEVRIYLDKPSDAGWVRSSSSSSGGTAPPLQRILAAVRPHVLPKLREENELAARGGRAASAAAGRGGSRVARKRSKKQRGIKDVVDGPDFEATVFLTEQSSRHSLLTKRKAFADKRPRLRGGGKGLAGWLNRGGDAADAIRVDGEEGILREDEGGGVDLGDIPEADADTRRAAGESTGEEPLFVNSDDDEGAEEADDKKKLALSTSYDGFSIYGRILCLIVKRKGIRPAAVGIPTGGSEMMEQWVGTQAAQAAGLDEDDDG